MERWQWAEARAREVLERYRFREIRTPLFEDYELFARTSGEASEMVEKEMYRFRDLKGRDLALRPEGTASVCRALLEHGKIGPGRVHRLWYLGPMFRYGRPQKGRYRQFWQVGAEIVGTDAPASDVEIIALMVDLFEAWGFEKPIVRINSLGTPEMRRRFAERLREWLAPARDRLSEDSQRRLETNPLRVLDSKDPRDRAVLAPGAREGRMPRLLDLLELEARNRFDAVVVGLRSLGIDAEIDHEMVRGLDRVLLELERQGVAVEREAASVYIVAMEGTRAHVQALARALRLVYEVEYDLEERSLNAQMKAADRSGARAVLLLGEAEWAEGRVVVKDLASGEQETLELDGLVDALDRTLGSPAPESPR